MYAFLSRFTFCKVKWQHFKGVVENVTLSCRKFSQLVKKFENLSTIDKVAICNAMSYFFGPPCISKFAARHLRVHKRCTAIKDNITF